MNCDFQPHDGKYRCSKCGHVKRKKTLRICDPERDKANRLRLGDRVERMFKRVGITPDKYKAAKAAVGLPPTCKCPQIKEWLNNASEWWNGFVGNS